MNDFSSSDQFGEQAKEIYALAGAALSQAQWFERTLINYVLQMSLHSSRHTKTDWDELESYLSNLTCGQLVRLTDELGFINDDLSRVTQVARDRRNELIHGFFYHHGANFYSQGGQRKILQQLSQIMEALEHAVISLERSNSIYRQQIGMTRERIQSEMESILLDQD